MHITQRVAGPAHGLEGLADPPYSDFAVVAQQDPIIAGIPGVIAAALPALGNVICQEKRQSLSQPSPQAVFAMTPHHGLSEHSPDPRLGRRLASPGFRSSRGQNKGRLAVPKAASSRPTGVWSTQANET